MSPDDSFHDDTHSRDFPVTVDRLTRTLVAVAADTPATDRSAADLFAALDRRSATVGEPPGPSTTTTTTIADDDAETDIDLDALDDAPRRRGQPRGRWWLAAAAGLAAVALGAVAVTSLGGDAEGRREVFASPGSPGTGWYLPPEGWEVTSVHTDYLDKAGCPCTMWAAAHPGDPGAVILMGDAVREPDPNSGSLAEMLGSEPIDVGGREAIRILTEDEEMTWIKAASAGRTMWARARGIDPSLVVAVADSWLDQREAGDDIDPSQLPLPDGFEATSTYQTTGTFSHAVIVNARNEDTGDEAGYRMVPAGQYRHRILDAAEIAADDGVLHGSPADGTAGNHILVGDRCDLLVGDASDGEGTTLDPAELDAFVGRLREVPTAEWRTAIDGAAEVDPDAGLPKVLEAPSLYEAPLTDG